MGDRLHPHNTWIDIPGVIDEKGLIRQSRGVTPSPGLYTLGLTWQHTRGSALLGWVGSDAVYLAQQIGAVTPRTPPAMTGTPTGYRGTAPTPSGMHARTSEDPDEWK